MSDIFEKFKIGLLYIGPQHTFSRFSGWLSRRRAVWFKQFTIRWFIQQYKVNVNEALITDINAYPTFNDFFIRQLKPSARPIVSAPNAIACPADSNVSEFGLIQHNKLIQAKQHLYSVDDLVADPALAKRLYDGLYCTLYLAPQYYHRVHIPLAGTLKQMIYVPGRLFGVNEASVKYVPELFSRNERVVCEFSTAVGDMVVILVGASQVGNICTSWHGQVAPGKSREVKTWNYEDKSIHLEKGAEVGYFTLGSTVIVLFPAQSVKWREDLQAGKKLLMGELLGQTL